MSAPHGAKASPTPPALVMMTARVGHFKGTIGRQHIYLFLGRPPLAAFGNSTGDQQMLEYTQSGSGVRLMSLVLHDDARREYAYGPGAAHVDTKFGAFTPALYDKAKSRGWIVISMKDDWKRLFAFES
jgi:hypothetical protein